MFASTGSNTVHCLNQFMQCLCFQMLSQLCFQPCLPCKPMVVAVQPDPLHSDSALLQTSGSCSLVGANSHNLHQTWFPCMPLCITDLFIMSHIPLSAHTYQWSLKPSSNQPAPLSSLHTYWQMTLCPVIPVPVLLYMLLNVSGNPRGMCPLFLY